jgi:hypothetical protein
MSVSKSPTLDHFVAIPTSTEFQHHFSVAGTSSFTDLLQGEESDASKYKSSESRDYGSNEHD